MIRKLTENYEDFDPKDFYSYIYDKCEKTIEDFEHNNPVQRIGAEFPTHITYLFLTLSRS